jgi:hypothetical protein
MQVRLKFLFWISFAIALAVYATMVLWTLPAIRIAASGQLAFDMRFRLRADRFMPDHNGGWMPSIPEFSPSRLDWVSGS